MAKTTKRIGAAKLDPPWQSAPYDDYDIKAMRALFSCNASETQQKRAVEWLIAASGMNDLSFRAGPDGDRATCFAEGKRFVIAQMIAVSRLKPRDE
jgi:hypothetical protein